MYLFIFIIFININLYCSIDPWQENAQNQYNTLQYIDDLAALNTNFILAAEEISAMESSRPSNYTSGKTLLSSISSFNSTNLQCDFIIVQSLISAFDIDKEEMYSTFLIQRTGDRTISFYNQSALGFVLNFIFDCHTNKTILQELQYLTLGISTQNVTIFEEDIDKILNTLLKPLPERTSRIHWFKLAEEITYKDIFKNDLINIFINDLRYSAWTYLNKELYAIYDMIEEQIISTINVNSISNPLEKSVIILMKEIEDINTRISLLPDNVFVLNLTEITISTSDNDIKKLINRQEIPMAANTKFKSKKIIGTMIIYRDHYNISDSPLTSFQIDYLLKNKDNEFYLSLVFDTSSTSSTLTKYCYAGRLAHLFWDAQDITINYNLKSARIYLPNAIAAPQDMSGEINIGSIKLFNPTAFKENNEGDTTYGIEFSFTQENINLISAIVKAQSLSMNEFCNAKYTVDNVDFLYPFYNEYAQDFTTCFLCSETYSQTDTTASNPLYDFNKNLKASISFSYQISSTITTYDDTLSDIESFLQMLTNQVTSLDNRITSLEEINQVQNYLIVLDFIDFGIGTGEFLKNVISKSSFAKKLLNPIKQAFVRSEKNIANGLGDEIREISKELIKEKSTSYDIAEALNSAAVFNFQHGHVKEEWFSETTKDINIKKLNVEEITNNERKDLREIMQLSAGVYTKFQKEMKSFTKSEFADFGEISVLSSPIEQLPVVGKYLHDFSSSSEGARSFLTNSGTRFPFHTSLSMSTFDIEEDGKYVLNKRFTGIAEPSIIGPTSKHSPRVKVGYVKIQYDIDKDGNKVLREWYNTKFANGQYTANDIDQLYRAFSGLETSMLNTDEKWELIVGYLDRKIDTRNVISKAPIQNSIFLDMIDDLLWFDKTGNSFKYNLFNNNCQNFALNLATFLSTGQFKYAMVESDFTEIANLFQNYADRYFKKTTFKGVIKNSSIRSLIDKRKKLL